ncbi:MAG TPA: L-lactate permease [Candidatus Acidoferrum sp.]|jgi:lactate permease|nr:L-lactate permease [Candidatus Acidoferrum sp.]
MDFLLAILPIGFLIYVMTKKKPWPSHISLPFAAILVYVLVLAHARLDPNLVNATVVSGTLSAFTPVSIIWGAILLSLTMRRSGAERVIGEWLKEVSANPVAQLMIVGWAFPFMTEGASGFGTPAAIAAPLLVGLGFDAVRVTILTLIMNAVPVTFGAVGTPMWFGLSQVPLSPSEILSVSWKSALVHSTAALVVPIIALRFAVGWAEIRQNLFYIYLSILSCVLPSLILSRFNYEFPSLIGGAIGLCLSALMAKYQVGLARTDAVTEVVAFDPPSKNHERLRAFTPYVMLIAILVVTRVRFLPLRAWLNAESPALTLDWGSLGNFSVSAALVFRLDAIFHTSAAWSYHALFVPALIPFIVVAALSIPLLRIDRDAMGKVVADTTNRLRGPTVTLVGALVMVQLMTLGGDRAQTMIIGRTFAGTGRSWPFFAPVLGALGAFFAGSATVSNLTFAGIQDSIARTLGFDRTSILALQSVGAAMGNMVAISNIVAVSSILGLVNQDGFVLKRTVIPLIVYGLVAGISGLILT